MDSNKKIAYVVTAGEYSDYGILAVFSTKELADAYVQNFNKKATENLQRIGYPNQGQDDATIEEWEMDIRE